MICLRDLKEIIGPAYETRVFKTKECLIVLSEPVKTSRHKAMARPQSVACSK